MLNISCFFKGANELLEKYGNYLEINSLPISIFLMQQDVINHYKHAITHYFPLTLKEDFLQNSSLGTPYQKWAKFTNEDFQKLWFLLNNLIRYTVRLSNESEYKSIKKGSEKKDFLSAHMQIIRRAKFIGVKVQTRFGKKMQIYKLKEGILQKDKINISNRNIIFTLKEEAEKEIRTLIKLNARYIETCKTFYADNDMLQTFSKLNGYWFEF